ncbi:MAG: hypothetical protein A2V88_10335 [Elusimicrobia bacterium RBG_16_66_12]|nr:MAG: hypothetical protein A2V88_10335 [Elusimicrobia bacterium RBG_16_66_12]
MFATKNCVPDHQRYDTTWSHQRSSILNSSSHVLQIELDFFWFPDFKEFTHFLRGNVSMRVIQP